MNKVFLLFFVLLSLGLMGAELESCKAPVHQTGQTMCWDNDGNPIIPCTGTGHDGDVQAGVMPPSPRFTDNGNGTITDNLTGLIWLKNANCPSQVDWADALTFANTLADPACGLSDGSVAGDWRLPNVRELHSLINFGFSGPALSDALGTGQWTEGNAFSNVISFSYWSSTTDVDDTDRAWLVFFDSGIVDVTLKVGVFLIGGEVFPVRGGL